MFRFSTCLTACCVGLGILSAQAADYHWSFDKRVAVSPYPRDAASRVKLTPDAYAGKNALSMTNIAGKNTSFYSFVKLPGEKGELILDFFHRMIVKGNAPTDFQVAMHFNKKGGRQGSAGGSQKLLFNSSDQWNNAKKVIPVPAEAVSMQIIVSAGNGNKTLFIDELKCSFVSDTVTVPVGSEAVLSGFYELTRPAAVQSKVKLYADKEKLRVTFINDEPEMESLVARATRHDESRIFSDDCNEVFIYDVGRNRYFQIVANTRGAVIDGERHQRVDGEPWVFSSKWNSHATARTVLKKSGYETTIEIPWSDLDVTFGDGLELSMDFCRERKVRTENSRWNCGGFFGDTGTFAKFKVADGKMTITRHRSSGSMSYIVKRAKPQFKSLLQKGVPGKYIAGSWTDGYSKPSLGKNVAAKISNEDFARWQEDLMNAWGSAGMEGPFFPWAKSHLVDKLEGMEKYHKKWKMLYPFFTYNSSYRKAAIAAGAKYVSADKRHVSPVDPVVRQVMINLFRGLPKWGKEYEYMKRMASYVEGPDEPTNALARIFTVSGNPEYAPALKELSEVIKRDYGFGKYGLPDDAVQADANRPFERIAFMRWWNSTLRDTYQVWRKEVAAVLPGIPFKAANNNTTAGCAPMDYALIAEASDILGVDPYPTSVTRVFDHARAVHHTGFSVRLLRDLAPKCKIHATLQGFVYHSGKPGRAELNEWTSQALKNGAEGIIWYNSSAVREIFPEFVYMINLSKMVTELEKIKLPTETVTGILHCDYDTFALNDIVLNPAYSLYVILGEHIKSNFRFVSPSGIANRTTPLEGLKLLYVPRGAYTTPELSAALRKWVADGGTLISFDPRFQSWNIDGTVVADRREFTGAELGGVKNAGQLIKYGKNMLKLAENRHIKMPTGFAVESYSLKNIAPAARSIAAYSDGTPAAIEYAYGKGKVISFAAQPFGNAALALEPGKWLDFFRSQAKAVNEKTNLAIWDFTLPEAPEAVSLKKNW